MKYVFNLGELKGHVTMSEGDKWQAPKAKYTTCITTRTGRRRFTFLRGIHAKVTTHTPPITNNLFTDKVFPLPAKVSPFERTHLMNKDDIPAEAIAWIGGRKAVGIKDIKLLPVFPMVDPVKDYAPKFKNHYTGVITLEANETKDFSAWHAERLKELRWYIIGKDAQETLSDLLAAHTAFLGQDVTETKLRTINMLIICIDEMLELLPELKHLRPCPAHYCIDKNNKFCHFQ